MSRPARRPSPWSGLDQPILVILILLMAIGVVLSFAASPAVSVAGGTRTSPPSGGFFAFRKETSP